MFNWNYTKSKYFHTENSRRTVKCVSLPGSELWCTELPKEVLAYLLLKEVLTTMCFHLCSSNNTEVVVLGSLVPVFQQNDKGELEAHSFSADQEELRSSCVTLGHLVNYLFYWYKWRIMKAEKTEKKSWRSPGLSSTMLLLSFWKKREVLSSCTISFWFHFLALHNTCYTVNKNTRKACVQNIHL